MTQGETTQTHGPTELADPSHTSISFWKAFLGSCGVAAGVVIAGSVIAGVLPSSSVAASGQAPLQEHAIDIVVWLLVPVAIGALFGTQRLAAYLGFLSALLAIRLLDATRTGLPGTEWSSFGDMIDTGVLIVYLVIAAPLLLLGAHLAKSALRGDHGRSSVFRVIAIPAVVSILVVGSTIALSVAIPDGKSFAVDLPSSWVASRYPSFDTTYGTDFTAVMGVSSAEPFNYYNPPAHPVLGVSVVALSSQANPFDCFRAFDGWPGNPMIYQSQNVSFQNSSLPAGAVYQWSGSRDGLTFNSYTFSRERRLVYDTRQLCYMLVVTVPDAMPMSVDDVEAIANSFRFR